MSSSHQPITKLEVENYGCIKHAVFELTALHALIGPNDSGKSTALRALRTVTQFAKGDFGSDPTGPRPFDPMIDLSGATRISVSYLDGFVYRISTSEGGIVESVEDQAGHEVARSRGTRAWNEAGILGPNAPTQNQGVWVETRTTLRERLSKATMVRFDPDYLRRHGPLIPESKPIAFADERGAGLASVLDALINRDTETFSRIQADVVKLFPSVARIGLINISSAEKEVAATLTNGTRIGSKAMSEGLLYFLGFAALQHTVGSTLFLVEEPENGLHPARIADVMTVLREISTQGQVVIATHSPLVINELRDDEVSVVTRDEQGTHSQRIKDTPNFADRSKVYALGELWVSYANGSDEGPLLTGGSRP